MSDFSGKTAVITGAGRGIGRGIALRCGQEGMRVALAGLNEESLRRTEAELAALGVETLVVQTDVSNREDVERLQREVTAAFGPVHLLVNNAGVGLTRTVLNSTYDEWDWVMGVNFKGVLHGVKTFLPAMVEAGEACHVVNISSLNGMIAGTAQLSSYSASKQAVVGLTEALYGEMKAEAPHVRVTVYCPGPVQSDLADAERNRPSGAASEASEADTARDAGMRALLGVSMSAEQCADGLFAGLAKKQLYVGAGAFREQHPDLGDWVRSRAEMFLSETNP